VGNTARLSSVAYPNGQDTNYSYHPAVGDFRLKTIDNRDAANSILSKFDYQYSPTGNITRGDQVLGSIRSENRAYDYDRADQLIGSTYLNPTTQTVLKQFGYAFDLIGNRLSETIHTPSVNETIWSEEFTGQNGKGGFVSSGVETTDTAGVDWSVDLANVDLANDASGDWFQVKDEVFEGVDLDGEAVWLSPNIDISDHSNIAFTLDTAEDGSLESSDYLHVIYSTDGGTNFTDINNWNTQGDSTHSLVDDWTSETITVDNLSGSAFQLRVAMQNNANTEKIRLDNVAVTGDSQPETLVTEASFNNLNQLISLTGGGKLVFSGNTDEPATVTLEGAPAQLSAGGEHFSANLNLPSGLNTVTIEATDVNSNTTTQDYEVDVTPGASRAVSYDANGNMTNNGAGQTFAWDAENRLIKITRGTETTEFTFDGNGRRVRIIEKDNSIQTANNWYVWDGAQIVEKRNETGGSWRRRYYGQGFVDSSDGKLFYTKDHLGSIREVVADDGTTVEAVYDYSPWGEVTKIGGSGLESDFLYTGHFYHDESDLHLTLYRAYNPELGMWLSRDPIAENGGLNLYAYVGNNPIMDWDPLGLEVSCTYDKSDGTVSMRDADTGATVTYPAESGGKPFGDSIPNGNYEILERKGRPGFYRLDPIDSVTRDDTHQPTGRDHFRLHGPGRTTGCVAAKNEDEWQDAKQLLDSTKTKTVEDYYGGKPSGPIERYGFIRVVD
jgi:RHS repeat-associated protein